MITLKLKLKEKIDISKFQKQWNYALRFAYNRFKDGQASPSIEKQLKSLNRTPLLDASWIRTAAIKALDILKTNKKAIFGSKKNFWLRKYKKITNEEYQLKRLLPIYSIGSKQDSHGNRKFALRIIEDETIVFKRNCYNHTELHPHLSLKQKQILIQLQQKSEAKEIPLTYSLDNEYVYVMYDECVFQKPRKKVKENRTLSLDLNPNYIGLVVVDWREDGHEVIHKEVICNKKLNTKDNRYQNKRKFESYETAKYIANLAKHFEVEIVGIEKLGIRSSDKGKGKKYNRLVNNQWNRVKFYQNLVKRCNIFNIKIQEVVASYSSFVGQMMNNNEPEMVAAAIEIGRRVHLFNKIYIKKTRKRKVDIVFPKYRINTLPTRWKEMAEVKRVKKWVDLYRLIKNSKFSYRVLWEDFNKVKCFRSLRLNSWQSKVSRFVLI